MPGGSHFAQAVLGLDRRQFDAGVAGAGRRWRGFTSQVLKTVGILAGARGIGAIATSIIKTGAAFEQSMANIKAVTRSSTDEILAMEKEARRLGATTSFSAQQVADGMTVLAKSTGSAAKSVQGIEAVLKLAGSEGANMTDAAELMISTMNAFGISFDESARVANVFAATAQNTRQSVERLKDSMKGISAIGREVGLGFEETTAAVGVLVDSGLEASQAGVLLRSALADILKASGPLADALRGVDIRTDHLAGVLKALSDHGIRGEEVFKKFNIRGASTVALLQRQIGRFQDLQSKITGTNGAWEAYATQQDTVSMAWKRVKSAFQEIQISVFQTFGTDLKGALDSLAVFMLTNRNRIATFAADVVKSIKIASLYVRSFAAEAPALARAVAAGFEAVDVGSAVMKALVPQWDRKVIEKSYAAMLMGDEEGAAFLMEAARKHSTAGEEVAKQFASGYESQLGNTIDTIKAHIATGLVDIENEYERQISRIAATDPFAEGPALTPPPADLQKWADDYFAQYKAGVLHAAEAGNAIFNAANRQTKSDAKRTAREIRAAVRQEYQVLASEVVPLYSNMMSAITDLTITGAERWKKIIGGFVRSFIDALNQMVAQTLAAKLATERILGGSTAGLVGLSLGLGFIASHNKFAEGGLFRGRPGVDQNVARLSDGEFVMPRRETQRFLPMLEEMRRGRLPQLAAAGGPSIEIHGHVHIPSGSILYANDEIGLRAISERIHRTIEKTVKAAFRE